eukprot:6065308-Pyramimonas_sp.AAC.1
MRYIASQPVDHHVNVVYGYKTIGTHFWTGWGSHCFCTSSAVCPGYAGLKARGGTPERDTSNGELNCTRLSGQPVWLSLKPNCRVSDYVKVQDVSKGLICEKDVSDGHLISSIGGFVQFNTALLT